MATFKVSFDYEIKYKRNDLLYFGINLFLGVREFPIRVQGIGSGGVPTGADLSPLSTTFTFNSPTNLSFGNTSFFYTDGVDNLELDMFYTNTSTRNSSTFRMGSVALRLVTEFNSVGSGASLNNFFSDNQYIEISTPKVELTIDSKTTELTSKITKIRLGKQYGEILLLSFLSST